MAQIQNPIVAGFNPDPSVIRVGADYYLATSTFEWLPAVQLFHSSDLRSWRLIGHALEGMAAPDLVGTPSSGGVWAPSLSHDASSGAFYLVYSIMRNQVGEQFDVHNFVVTAADIRGPWSAPTYLNSVGFDPSLFHDDDGRMWLTTLEWDPREGYEGPGPIVLEEFDPVSGTVVGPTHRISRGATDRGCLEAPHLYKHDGRYYLMTAEGGTGFGHGVALARSDSLLGPWEPDPRSPFITSWTPRFFARNDRDHLRPRFFAPGAPMQKAGHGSLVDTPDGEWYVAHLSSRPIGADHRSVLGRETSIQQVAWSSDGWLRLTAGGTQAQATTPAPAGTPDGPIEDDRFGREDFDSPEWNLHLVTPRRPATPDWADLTARPGHLRLRGQDSLFSRFDVAFVGARLQGFDAVATTEVDFHPVHFSQAAGLVAYYSTEWFHALRVYSSESLGGTALGLFSGLAGVRQEYLQHRVRIQDAPVQLRATLHDGALQFAWRQGEAEFADIGPVLDATLLSDEVTHGFTGTIIGVTCQDATRRRVFADFDFLELRYP